MSKETWPLMDIGSDENGGMSAFNGATIPVKMVACVADHPTGGCTVHAIGGHTVTLCNVSRARFTELMRQALAGEGGA